MKARTVSRNPGGISDKAVQEATSRTWGEWFALLDRAGAAKLDHKAIVAILAGQFALGPWWQQMVTVAYEQERGLRRKHEQADGFQVSRSKTMAVPVSSLFEAWRDGRQRARWLGERNVQIRKATPHKSIRITWIDGRTHVECNFYARGATRSQVTVQHRKLPSAAAGEQMKQYWGEKLDALQRAVER